METEYDFSISEYRRKQSNKRLAWLVFMAIIWAMIVNAGMTMMIQSVFCEQMKFEDLFWAIPDNFFWEFFEC